MDQEIKTVIQYPTGSTEFDIPFDYLSRKFVRVSLVSDDNRRLLSNITEYRYVSKTRVRLLVDTSGFDRVEIRRFTSASERIVDFSDGSVLRAADLNVSQLQSAHIAEEARDAALLSIGTDDLGNLDAKQRRIVNLADPVDESDAANLKTVKSLLSDDITKAIRLRSPVGPLTGAQRQALVALNQDGQPYGFPFEYDSELGLAAWLASPEGSSGIGTISGLSLSKSSRIAAVTKELADSSGDCGPVIRKLISAGYDIQVIGRVPVLTHDSVPWRGCFDDGSIDPVRISRGQDVTLPPLAAIDYPVYLNVPATCSIIMVNPEVDYFDFGWDGSVVNPQLGIGIVQRVDGWDGTYSAVGVNRMSAFITGSRMSLSVRNAVIGYVADGVQHFADWGYNRFVNCALPVVWQGADRCNVHTLEMRAVLAGFISGGHYLQRNDVNFRGGVYIPPYVVGRDIFSLGWTDSLCIGNILYQGRGTWGPLYQATDAMFDEMFWRSDANSRISKMGPDRTTLSTLVSDHRWRGVAGRAVSIICRANRDSGGNVIRLMKVFYSPRVPVWVNPRKASDWAQNITIHQAFIEKGGLFNSDSTVYTVGGPNDFYSAAGDSLNSDRTKMPYSVLEGPGHVLAPKFANSITTTIAEYSMSLLGRKRYNYVYADSRDSTDWYYRDAFKFDNGDFLITRTSYFNREQMAIPFTWSALNANPILYFKHIRKVLSRTPVLYNGTAATANAFSPASYSGTIELRDGRVVVKVSLTLPDGISTKSGRLLIGIPELNNYFPFEGADWSVPAVFSQIANVPLNESARTKGVVTGASRVFAAIGTAPTQNNMSLRYGQWSGAPEVLCEDLSSLGVLNVMFEYDTDSRTYSF